MNRFVALIAGGAALFIGFMALQIAFGPKGDASGWVMVLIFAGGAAFLARMAWKDWNTPDSQILKPPPARSPSSSAAATSARPDIDPVPLEDQINALRDAGLTMAPGRTIDELLESWSREDYESDPYNLLLFMFGSEVEAEPWGRAFCERGWDFDMECLSEAGDYARAFERIVRTTGQLQLVTDLSDNFDVDAPTAEIKYAINGRRRVLKAKVNDDWADPEAVTAFVKDVEVGTGDHRRFWAADNGQSSVLFFITGAEATAINALRAGILERYAAS